MAILTGRGGRPPCVRDESKPRVSGTERDMGERVQAGANEHTKFAATGLMGRVWKSQLGGGTVTGKRTCGNHR